MNLIRWTFLYFAYYGYLAYLVELFFSAICAATIFSSPPPSKKKKLLLTDPFSDRCIKNFVVYVWPKRVNEREDILRTLIISKEIIHIGDLCKSLTMYSRLKFLYQLKIEFPSLATGLKILLMWKKEILKRVIMGRLWKETEQIQIK